MNILNINLYSTNKNDIKNFLNSFYNNNIVLKNNFKWHYSFNNPTELIDILSALIENNDKYNINIWISLDPHIYIYVSEKNLDKIIRYIFERFPY